MKLFYLFVFVLILSFQSCSKYDSCGENLPIEISKIVGSVNLIDSTKSWIESVDTVLNFVNKNGNIVKMNVSAPYFKTNLNIISKIPIPSQCSNITQINTYSIPIEQREYSMSSMYFNLILSREKSEYSNYIYDSNNTPLQRALKMGDELKIDMKFYTDSSYYGNYYETPLTIIPKDKWVMARKIIYDTLTVGGKLYQNVYYCYRDTSDLSWLKSQQYDLSRYPMGVYYAFNNGIIGFTLLNGDYWFRK